MRGECLVLACLVSWPLRRRHESGLDQAVTVVIVVLMVVVVVVMDVAIGIRGDFFGLGLVRLSLIAATIVISVDANARGLCFNAEVAGVKIELV